MKPLDRLLLLTSESPSPRDDTLPKISRFWPQNYGLERTIPKQETLQTNTPASPDRHHQTPQRAELGLETEDQVGSCVGQLCGLPCFWCLDELVRDGDKPAAETTTIDDHREQVETSAPQSLSKGDQSRSSSNSTLTGEPEWLELYRSERTELPPVLYRWSNADSLGINTRFCFTAGMFAPSNTIAFSPSSVSEQSFLDMFKNHVTKVPLPTPFISTFQGPLAPIHRGLRNGQGATVSLIDTSKLSTAVFKAAPLVALTNTALPNWKGYGEYLIWHQVPSSAIACTFTIANLEAIASTFADIGHFLQLDLIKQRHHCTRFLYSDLAFHVPNSQDGHATTLQRLTTLLGVPGTVRQQVIEDFKKAWTKKFWGLRFEMPEDRVVHPPNPACEFELQGSAELLLFSQTGQKQRSRDRSLSNSSYRPSVIDAGGSSSSGKSDPPTTRTSEEPEAKCPRRDTPSDGYSVCDDSSEEDCHPAALDGDDDFEMMDQGQDQDTDWPSDGEIPESVPICWRSSLQD